ncbi:hypothetical protein HELRODRAFT_96972 [Helobdella robusta]|uniref:SPOC domain-containing protein n=1 Tax=Helobdella robusta TaxID=6412 RepID=T1G9E7_HELRO|nr:hypothetical protein HELRODRAFT_96972 [Helobdella robusta]ESO10712.1 hypothetical protein HELRODRAFT_96972 [Helobdella robusta]
MLNKPIVWQGMLALKNDSATVQMHYVSGSDALIKASLPDNMTTLRIAQRMRLEPNQLEQVTKRMAESEYTMLLAVPSGHDHVGLMTQSHNLQMYFIQYLQQKQAAGIVNIFQPNTNQAAYVVHIFPPCEFSLGSLRSKLSPEALHSLTDGGYLLIIITTC